MRAHGAHTQENAKSAGKGALDAAREKGGRVAAERERPPRRPGRDTTKSENSPPGQAKKSKMGGRGHHPEILPSALLGIRQHDMRHTAAEMSKSKGSEEARKRAADETCRVARTSVLSRARLARGSPEHRATVARKPC